MDVAQQSGHVFQPPMGPPPNNLGDKSAILQQQQQSVIQSNQQLQQQLQSMHDNNENRQKSREILTRRPSYRLVEIICVKHPDDFGPSIKF